MKEGQELWPSVQRGGLNESRETHRGGVMGIYPTTVSSVSSAGWGRVTADGQQRENQLSLSGKEKKRLLEYLITSPEKLENTII